MRTFTQKVLAVVKNIPKGEVLTYKQVAQKAGSPLASRAVGQIMAKNYDENIPCHRVIGSTGKLTGYNRGLAQKRQRLIDEGAIAKDYSK